MASYPLCIVWVHDSFGCRTDGNALFKGVLPCMCDPGYLTKNMSAIIRQHLKTRGIRSKAFDVCLLFLKDFFRHK